MPAMAPAPRGEPPPPPSLAAVLVGVAEDVGLLVLADVVLGASSGNGSPGLSWNFVVFA